MRLSSGKIIILAAIWLAALTVVLVFFLRVGDHVSIPFFKNMQWHVGSGQQQHAG